MKYDSALKLFVCLSNFQNIDDECIKIPKNKMWIKKIKQFVCIASFFELEDGSCRQLGENQVYMAETKKISCKADFYKLKGKCKVLPQHSTWN